MKSGRGAADSQGVAGGPVRHVPVLLDAVLTALEPKPGGLYLDGTFGAGGYARALLAIPETRVFATDRDPDALAGGAPLVAESAGRLTLERSRFSEILQTAARMGLRENSFDGVVFDVGVSSMQIDQADRGFSFRHDGPLDMRMSRSGRSAADIVNEDSEERIATILYRFGEERASRRIARAIVQDRAKAPFQSTRALAEMIARVAPAKPTEIHPATRTFQALRIAVNEELEELLSALLAGERLLAPGGRLAVVSFHSLEDRIVKQFFALRAGRGQARSRLLPGEPIPPEPTFEVGASRPVAPSAQESSVNPRSRSARLRYGVRTAASPRALDASLAELAALDDAPARRR